MFFALAPACVRASVTPTFDVSYRSLDKHDKREGQDNLTNL